MTGLVVRGDSQLVIYQMTGRYRVRSPNVLPLHRRARDLAGQIGDVRFEWIPRERNEPADSLSREAYRAVTGRAV